MCNVPLSEVEARNCEEGENASPHIDADSRPRRNSVDFVGSVVLKILIIVLIQMQILTMLTVQMKILILLLLLLLLKKMSKVD